VNCREIFFTRHAFERMFSRSIRPDKVRDIVERGETIIEYSDDTPFPSTLLLEGIQINDQFMCWLGEIHRRQHVILSLYMNRIQRSGKMVLRNGGKNEVPNL